MNRRHLIATAGAGLAALAGSTMLGRFPSHAAAVGGKFEVTKTDAEWRKILSDAQFRVLRQEDTEYPFTSPLLKEHRKGLFHCAGCDLAVYDSATKFDSGTGWPSFWQALPNAVSSKDDTSLLMDRTELHCSRCGGHLGHVFDDGPPPTGKRHCINGVALSFRPATA